MGLYDNEENYDYNDNFDSKSDEIGSAIIKSTKKSNKKLKLNIKMPKILDKVLIYIFSAIILIIIGYSIFLLLQPNLINAEINPNPVLLGKSTAAILTINIENVFEYNLNDIHINIEAIDKNSVGIINNYKKDFSILAPGESREIKTKIYLKNNVAGNYKILIKVSTDRGDFSKEIIWKVKGE